MAKGRLFVLVACLACLLLWGERFANAVDFNIRGRYDIGFGLSDNLLASKANGQRLNQRASNDMFKARQRFRVWFTAKASENVSGTILFKIPWKSWGKASDGFALGADGVIITIAQAFLDWKIPDTDISTRMGLQAWYLPAIKGSTIIADTRAPGVTVNAKVNENFGVTASWLRLENDNFLGNENGNQADYLDNLDLFFLSVPIKYENIELTPWVMGGMVGKNSLRNWNNTAKRWDNSTPGTQGQLVGSLYSLPFGNPNQEQISYSRDYGMLFWGVLPINLRFDAFSLGFEFDYGYAQSMGKYTVEKQKYGVPYGRERANTERQGWVLQALADYKLDWGVPGIFGWYGSGDDGNLKNGSERLPYVYAENQYTGMLGDNTYPFGGQGSCDFMLSLSGSWGAGLQIKDISFLPNLKHLLRAAWVGGTNSPSMVKYAGYLSKGAYDASVAWQGVSPIGRSAEFYLTTKDNLLEFDMHNEYKMYENFSVGLDLGYLVNMIDKDQWKKASNTTFSKQDAWKAELKFLYTFKLGKTTESAA